MDDEHERLDVDARLRAALAPDDDTTRRIVARALSAREEPPRRLQPIAGVAGVVAVLLLAAGGAWVSRSRIAPTPRPTPPARELSLTISGHGPIVVVERGDGRRWIVGPASAPRPGGYVIVVPRGRE